MDNTWYAYAFVEKLVCESVALSIGVPSLSALIAVGVLHAKGVFCLSDDHFFWVWHSVLLGVLLVSVARASVRWPHLVHFMPQQSFDSLYSPYYRAIMESRCAPMELLGAAYVYSAVAFLHISRSDLLFGLVVSVFVLLLLYIVVRLYNELFKFARRYKGLTQEECDERLKEDGRLLAAVRASILCWRLGWTAWVVEVLIYAGLSWALWRALAGGGVAWGQWRLAMYAALGVAALRLFERLSPRWAPQERAEAWAWRVRVFRLGIALAACAG